MKPYNSGKNKEEVFWKWFEANAGDYYKNLDSRKDELVSNLSSEIKKVHKDLVFEISAVLPDSTRELTISADGDKDLFPVVIALTAKAPKIKNWKFLAFRQPCLQNLEIQMGDFILSQDDIYFRYMKDGDQIGIQLNIRNYIEGGKTDNAAFILLDNMIGEYDAVMSISSVDLQKLDESKTEEMYPLTYLPTVLQEHKARLSGLLK